MSVYQESRAQVSSVQPPASGQQTLGSTVLVILPDPGSAGVARVKSPGVQPPASCQQTLDSPPVRATAPYPRPRSPEQRGLRSRPESIEWFIEAQAVLQSYDSSPRPPPYPPLLWLSASCLSFSVFLCAAGRELSDGRVGRGWARSQIIRLALYKSYNESILSWAGYRKIWVNVNEIWLLRGIKFVCEPQQKMPCLFPLVSLLLGFVFQYI